MQVRIPLAMLAKIVDYLKTKKCSIAPAIGTGMYQWFDCHLSNAVVSQGISRPNAENCPGFPPPLDSRRLGKKQKLLSLTSST